MADTTPATVDMSRGFAAARAAQASAVKNVERNISTIIADVGRSTNALTKNVGLVKNIPGVSTVSNALIASMNPAAVAIGVTMKLSTAVIDVMLKIQNQFNGLRRETVLTGAGAGMSSTEIDTWVKVNIDAFANLKSSLHITMGDWNKYLQTYRQFAISVYDMNTAVNIEGQKMSKSLTESIFDLNSRFQMDATKTTQIIVSSITKGNIAGENLSQRAGTALSVWYDVAKGARYVGSSVPKAINLIAGITMGTESQVTSGAKRVLGLSDMYAKLFQMLSDNHQQGLIEDYFKAIESGIRNMTIESAVIFSGGPISMPSFGGAGDALTAGLDLMTVIRTGKDAASGATVQPIEVFQSMINALTAYTGQKQIMAYDEIGKAGNKYLSEQRAKTYWMQDIMLRQMVPAISDPLRRSRFFDLMKQIQDNRFDSSAKRAEAMDLIKESLSDTAEGIEDQKLNFLSKLGDIMGAWYDHVMFGEDKDARAERLRQGEYGYLLAHGTVYEEVSKTPGYENMSAEEKRAVTDKVVQRRRKDYEPIMIAATSARDPLYRAGHAAINVGPGKLISGGSSTEASMAGARLMAEQIKKEISQALSSKNPPAKYLRLVDKRVSPEERGDIIEEFVGDRKKQMLKNALPEERGKLEEIFKNAVLLAAMNPALTVKGQKDNMLGAGVEGMILNGPGGAGQMNDLESSKWWITGLARFTPAKLLSMVWENQVSPSDYNPATDAMRGLSAEERKKRLEEWGRAPKKPALSGVFNTYEGEVRSLHEGEMIIPRNQADIIRMLGGPGALFALLAMSKIAPDAKTLLSGGDNISEYMAGVLGTLGGVRKAMLDKSPGGLVGSMAGDGDGASIENFVQAMETFTHALDNVASNLHIRPFQTGGTVGANQVATTGQGEMVVDKTAAAAIGKAGGAIGATMPPPPAQKDTPPLLKVPGYVMEALKDTGMTETDIMATKFGIAINESTNNYMQPNLQWDDVTYDKGQRVYLSGFGKYQFLKGTAHNLWMQNKEKFEGLGIKESDFENRDTYRKMMSDPKLGPARQEVIENLSLIEDARLLRNNGIAVNRDTLAFMHMTGGADGLLQRLKQDPGILYHGTLNPTASGNVRNQNIPVFVRSVAENSAGFEAARASGLLLSAGLMRSRGKRGDTFLGAIGSLYDPTKDKSGRLSHATRQTKTVGKIGDKGKDAVAMAFTRDIPDLFQPVSGESTVQTFAFSSDDINSDVQKESIELTSNVLYPDGSKIGTCTMRLSTKTSTRVIEGSGYAIF